jgi:pSer/pThr/pTyr-binding forkhead associated (FHA) protein
MRVKLKVLNGKSAGREVKVPETGFLIGRGQECHLRPKSDAISRRHCEIAVEGEKAVIRDMGSKNGTYVNGTRIDGEQELSQSDQLLVGKLELEVIIEVLEQVVPQSDDDSWAVDGDISTWLEDGDTAGRESGDPDTRQFKVDELQQTTNDESTLNGLNESTMEETTSGSDDGKKKGPGKLPARQNDSEDSKAAADDILKRFFNRP